AVDVRRLGSTGLVNQLVGQRYLTASAEVERRAAGECQQPGRGAAAAPIVEGRFAPDAYEHLLGAVLQLAADDLSAGALDRAPVTVAQLLEGRLAALADRAQQLRVARLPRGWCPAGL